MYVSVTPRTFGNSLHDNTTINKVKARCIGLPSSRIVVEHRLHHAEAAKITRLGQCSYVLKFTFESEVFRGIGSSRCSKGNRKSVLVKLTFSFAL